MPTITDRDEALERSRLDEVLRVLELARARVENSIGHSAEVMQASKELIWERQRDMDHADKANVRIEVDVSVGVAERAVEARRRIERLMQSPYFGRVDCRSDADTSSRAYYIGLHGFRDPDSAELLVHDWRAPVSALYYDFESGEASFQAPEGTAHGQITGKRQYKIEGGELRHMLESTLNIGDDILQQELSRSADEKMKNIVATIQREQNAVIRNEAARVLILQGVADVAVHQLKAVITRKSKWTAADTTSVRQQVRAMFPHKNALEMYKAFYRVPEREELLVPLGRKKIEYADVFPLIFTMLTTTRQESPYAEIRHLLVDEMQDYTPVQYAVLRHLFPCRMTILGDANQSVNPFSSSSLETIHRIFPEADCLEPTKSYRSTAEITEFAQNISRNDKLTPIERHGTPPRIVACTDEDEEVTQILELIEAFHCSGHRSLGIICKTVAHAESLSTVLRDAGADLTFLDYGSTAFSAGVIITSAHIAKGLEFDAVIAPHVDHDTYANGMDKSMLYIACTRAMHELTLTHSGTLSPFLAFARAAVRR